MVVVVMTKEIMECQNLFWQYPAITEKIFYEQNKTNENFIGFPWATMIDKRIHPKTIVDMLRIFVNPNINYYTCCQHIHFRQLIPLFKGLNINCVFTPHKVKGEDQINDVFINPCPLYAVNLEDPLRNNELKNVKLLEIERPLLYSFHGAYNPKLYLSDIRKNIFEMEHPDNTSVKNIGGWFYESIVYSDKQNKNGELNETKEQKDSTQSYNKLLLNSRYSLCPSGSGPNSIRFWESLGSGAIPILLSDSLELPEHKLWKEAIVRIPETQVEKIPEIIGGISEEQENSMHENCLKIYQYFSSNYRKKTPQIVHYCCGSYKKGDYGGVARYDYHISQLFPQYRHFTGPREKNALLSYLRRTKGDVIVITDNHLACDIPNEYKVLLVHHGVAETHAVREPDWNKYWKDLCCNGQKQMLYHRKPETTKIISISQFCTEEFTKYHGDKYKEFKNTKILHTSELDESTFKKEWNKNPVIMGNWKDKNKGKFIVETLMKKGKYQFVPMNVYPNKNNINEWNKRKQKAYLDCDVYLQLSLCEGNSYATLDALLCGIPVISSNVGLFYKDVPDDCFVKIDWERMNDEEYIEEKINDALENKEELGRKGREWYLKNCSFNLWKNKMKKVINE